MPVRACLSSGAVLRARLARRHPGPVNGQLCSIFPFLLAGLAGVHWPCSGHEQCVVQWSALHPSACSHVHW